PDRPEFGARAARHASRLVRPLALGQSRGTRTPYARFKQPFARPQPRPAMSRPCRAFGPRRSALAALQVALAEQVRIELLVELDVGDLDHGVRARSGGRHLDVVRNGGRADRLDGARGGPLLRLGLVLVELEPAWHQVVAPEPDDHL